MNVAVVLETDDIMMTGHNKDSHFDQTETVKEYWYKQKLPAKLFKHGEDTIVDICSGTHFTLVVTKSGKLLGIGKQFLSVISVNQEEAFFT
jgi:alpha-tubulin suppressor-like RCC1 family protein